MAEQTIRVGMLLSEFMQEYAKAPFELVEGRVMPLSPNVLGHQLVVKILFRLLDSYVAANKLGEAFFETPFVLADKPDWVRGSRTPDISYFSRERWASYLAQQAEARGKPIILIPDLAVEVVSPNDLYSELQEKVDGYLADGVQLVWVVDPQRRKVVVYTTDSDTQTTLGDHATLTGDDVLTGFSVPVTNLFE